MEVEKKDKEDSEESEDQGLCFDDIISPGGQHLTFGSFKHMEINNLFTVMLRDNVSATINEYGTNFYNSKFDSLAAIEAKNALRGLKNQSGSNHADLDIDKLPPKSIETIHNVLEVQHSPSPLYGTQEPPQPYLSSQEDTLLKSAAGDYGEGVAEMVVQLEIDDATPVVERDNMEEEKSRVCAETLVEDVVEEKLGEHEEDQGVIDTIWTENEDANHHPMRQSRRIKEQGLGHLKMADKAEALQANKNLEGNSLKFKNSFAVLENDVLLDRTNKMSINSKKIDLEFFDIMNDLELARANLIERAKEDKQDKTNASSDTELPSEEIKFIT